MVFLDVGLGVFPELLLGGLFRPFGRTVQDHDIVIIIGALCLDRALRQGDGVAVVVAPVGENAGVNLCNVLLLGHVHQVFTIPDGKPAVGSPPLVQLDGVPVPLKFPAVHIQNRIVHPAQTGTDAGRDSGLKGAGGVVDVGPEVKGAGGACVGLEPGQSRRNAVGPERPHDNAGQVIADVLCVYRHNARHRPGDAVDPERLGGGIGPGLHHDNGAGLDVAVVLAVDGIGQLAFKALVAFFGDGAGNAVVQNADAVAVKDCFVSRIKYRFHAIKHHLGMISTDWTPPVHVMALLPAERTGYSAMATVLFLFSPFL